MTSHFSGNFDVLLKRYTTTVNIARSAMAKGEPMRIWHTDMEILIEVQALLASLSTDPSVSEKSALSTSSLPQITSIDARVKELTNRIVELTAALRLHDDYMSAQYHDGPDCGSLHPKAAANWKQIRSALSQGSPGQ